MNLIKTFKKIIKILENKGYIKASKEMLNSESHIKTPVRCERFTKSL